MFISDDTIGFTEVEVSNTPVVPVLAVYVFSMITDPVADTISSPVRCSKALVDDIRPDSGRVVNSPVVVILCPFLLSCLVVTRPYRDLMPGTRVHC